MIPIVIGIIVAIAAVSLSSYDVQVEPESQPIYETGFTYYDIELVQDVLAEQNIKVSTPTAITDHTIPQYCPTFDRTLPKNVNYCTTTAVVNSEGKTIGNINLGGNVNAPIMAVANIETKTLDSNQDEVHAIFVAMIESLVCDCWEEEQSEDMPTITSWLDTVQTFYYDSGERNIKSKIDNLADYQIILEITSKDNSILQTLIILK